MVYSCKLIAIQECTDRGSGVSGARQRMEWSPILRGRRRVAGGSPDGTGSTSQRIQTHRNPRGGQRDSQRSGRLAQTHRQHMIATERKPALPYSRLGSAVLYQALYQIWDLALGADFSGPNFASRRWDFPQQSLRQGPPPESWEQRVGRAPLDEVVGGPPPVAPTEGGPAGLAQVCSQPGSGVRY